jgi:hypothetical protein
VIDRHTTLIVWAILGAAVVGCQLVAVLSKGRLPGLGTVVGRVTSHRVGQYALVLAWMWLGWHAFAR